MPESIVDSALITSVYIKVNGSEIGDEVVTYLVGVEIDSSLLMPEMLRLSFIDSTNPENTFHKAFPLIDGDVFPLGATVQVEVGDQDDPRSTTTIFKGEITAVEPHFNESMEARIEIQAYDKSWRLFRETKMKAWLEVTDSDIAGSAASNAGLTPEVERTSEVFKHVFQDNQSDLAFLLERAWRIGYEAFASDGKLYFRKPDPTGAAIDLEWGRQLKSFRPRLSLAEQVDEVTVKGWDVQKKETITGQANSSTTSPQINVGGWGGAVAQSKVSAAALNVVDVPVQSQADADSVAKGRLDELNGAFIEAEGEAFGVPELKAGMLVNLTKLGTKFSGKYKVTRVTHVYTQEKHFETHFAVSGIRSGTTAERLGLRDPRQRWYGVYPAIVTNNEAPEDWGMVKVKFPWLANTEESNWARIVTQGGGAERGFYNLPEINDEVLVVFEQGDINRPYVLGGLWNGKDQPPEAVSKVVQNGEVQTRVWKSRIGHAITLVDESGAERIEVVSKNGHTITLDDGNQKMELKTTGGHTVTLDDASKTITIKSVKDIVVDATGNINMKAKQNVTIEAMANLNLKATASLNAEGLNTTVKGNANVSVQGGAMAEVKGALVKIN